MLTYLQIRYLDQTAAAQDGLLLEVQSIPLAATLSQIEECFRRVGLEFFLIIAEDPHDGCCRAFFPDKRSTEVACRALDGVLLMGQPIQSKLLRADTIASPTPAEVAASTKAPATIPVPPSEAPNKPSTPTKKSVNDHGASSSDLARAVTTTNVEPGKESLQDQGTFSTNLARAITTSVQATKAPTLLAYPGSWHHNPKEPWSDKTAFLASINEIVGRLRAQGVPRLPSLTTSEGKPALRGMLRPPPKTGFEKTIRIFAAKAVDGNIQVQPIDAFSLEKFVQDGWVEWNHPPRATDHGSDYDSRQILIQKDTWDSNDPSADTNHMFSRATEKLKSFGGWQWSKGRLLGGNETARAEISNASTPVKPCSLPSGLPSATSRGHLPVYPRSSRVGAGWGEYDLFHEWQMNGRVVKKEFLEEAEWARDPKAPIRLEAEKGPKKLTVTTDSSDFHPKGEDPNPEEIKQPPKTLLEKIIKPKGKPPSTAPSRIGRGRLPNPRGQRSW